MFVYIDEVIVVEFDVFVDLILVKGCVYIFVGQCDEVVVVYVELFGSCFDKQIFVWVLGFGYSLVIDVVVIDLCLKICFEIIDDEVFDFIEVCLFVVGGSVIVLIWKGVKKDLVVYCKEME